MFAVFLPLIGAGASQALVTDKTETAMAFLNANRLYADGDYLEAAQAYQSLIESGVKDPAVYYNLANAFHKLNRTAEAILYFERAHRLAPRDRDIQLNLEIAGMAAVDEIIALPQHLIFRLGHRFQDYLNPNEKLYLVIAGYLLLILGLHLILFDTNRRRRFLWSAVTWFGAAVIILFGLSATVQVVGERNHPPIIVMDQVARVRAEPDLEGEEIFTIHAGARATTEDRRGDWIVGCIG